MNFGIKLLNVANIEKTGQLNLSKTDRHLSVDEVESRYQHFLIDEGDLVIASSGISFDQDGLLRTRGAFVESQHLPLCLNTSTIRFKAKSGASDLTFLKHWLDSREFREQITKLVTGSAQQNFGPSHLKATQITLPPLPEQRRIAAILDQADALRTKRREALSQLDSLTQSIFIEMFGDPITNPKGWPVTKLGQFLLDVTNGLTRRGNEAEAGKHIVLRLRDIRADSIDFSEPNRITLDDKELAKYQVTPGELLFIRVNGNPDYVGRCALFNGHEEPIFFNDHVMRVRLKDGLIGGYLSHFLNRPEGKRQIAKHRKTSAGQHTINQDGLAAISLPIPDEPLQRLFIERLAAVHKCGITYNKAYAELDALFSSLQHRAFRGEL